MDFIVEVRKTKSNAKCRVCNCVIVTGQLGVFSKGFDNFNHFQLVVHPDCFLKFIIKKVKEFKINELEEEQKIFKDIEKLLNPKKSGIKKIKKKGD